MEPPFGDAFQNYSFVDQALTSTELLATSSDPDFMYELVSRCTNTTHTKCEHTENKGAEYRDAGYRDAPAHLLTEDPLRTVKALSGTPRRTVLPCHAL